MVSKKILGMAIAAAFSSQAFAAIDMTAGTGGAGTGVVTVAKEAVTALTNGLVQVTHATAFDTTFALGFGTSAGSRAFIRIDLTGGAKFKTAVSAASLSLTGKTLQSGATLNDYNVSVGQGGAAGDTFVIYDVTANTAMAQAQAVVLDLADMQLSPSAANGMTVAHYSTSPAAVGATATNTTGALATDSYTFANVSPALKVTISGSDKIADVNVTPVFSQFTGATTTATLGNVKLILTSGAITPAGAAVTALNQLIDTGTGKSKLAVTGDLSFIGKTSAAITKTKLTFGGVNADEAGTSTSIVSTGQLSDLSGLLVETTATDPLVGNDITIIANGADAINAGAYSLTFTPTNIGSAVYGAATASGSLGTITRNGATAQVPYITTNAGLNQKLVLVNRGTAATTYSVTFTPEAGVTATAGAAATGTLAAKQTKVLKASDLVTLTGGTRTAATVVALAPAGNIDAATQTVVTDPASVSFGSNDTVNLTVK